MVKKEAYFRVVGDVHGKYSEYLQIVNKSEYSICVGDIGFNYGYLKSKQNQGKYDPSRHKLVAGNHDNYGNKIITESGDVSFGEQTPHFLGEFGVWKIPDFSPIYFVRGAYSIDKNRRTTGLDWWPDEELTQAQGIKAIEDYELKKPNFMVTHSVPKSLIPIVPFRRLAGYPDITSSTEVMLDFMYNAHQPDIWLFGHYHIDWDYTYQHPQTGKKTRFICLDELSYKDFSKSI